LADYITGMQSEKVPFVFLPAQGQLINPNAEIALSGTDFFFFFFHSNAHLLCVPWYNS
jgi:hypothetical protein